MTNIQGWAVAAVMVVVAGCTTEATTASDGGATSAASGGSAGAAGSTTTSSGAGGSATGGSGGSGDDGGGAVCTAKASDTTCRTCALGKCKTALCACEMDTGCAAQVDMYFDCVSKAKSTMEEDACSSTFVVDANPTGGGKAGDVASCMTTDTNCASICQGSDAGPRR